MQLEELKDIILHLKNTDLNNTSHSELKHALEKLGKFGVIEFTLHPGYDVIRASPNGSLYESFFQVDRVSYKPKEFNKNYLRASTPEKTMFYGCCQQFENPKKIESIGRITALIESMPKLRDKEVKGITKITFSRWSVNSEVKLIAICHKKQFIEKVPQMKLMYDSYQSFLSNNPSIEEHSLLVSSFLADEFSKEVGYGDFNNYMISAIYTEIIQDRGFKGVIYPSVPTAGDGINIAVAPEIVNDFFECKVVGECYVFKNKEQIKVLDGSSVELAKGQKTFELSKFSKTVFDQPIFSSVINELDLWDFVHEIV